MLGIILGILVLIVLIVVITNIKIVPQASVYVVERLGAYYATWETGLHFKMPFFDRIAKRVSLKEQVAGLRAPARSSPATTSPCRLTRSSFTR